MNRIWAFVSSKVVVSNLRMFLDVVEGNLFIVYVFDYDHAAKEGWNKPTYE